MHCWHQKVRIEPAGSDDHYGDVFVDTNQAFVVYQEWFKKTRPQVRTDCGVCGGCYGR
jgi:hypothetical protein